MDEKEFNALWDKIALKEIARVVAFCKSNGLRIEQRDKSGSVFKKNTNSEIPASTRTRAKIFGKSENPKIKQNMASP